MALNNVGLYFKPIICSHGGWPLRIDAMELGAGRRLVTTLRFSRQHRLNRHACYYARRMRDEYLCGDTWRRLSFN